MEAAKLRWVRRIFGAMARRILFRWRVIDAPTWLIHE
jgi:hypothetical protein